MKKGEVWWARLSKPVGARPVLLLSRDEAYLIRESITIAPVTTRRRGLFTEVPLSAKDGMPRECVVNLDSMATIEKVSLIDRICELSPEKMNQVHGAIQFALDLP